MIDLKPGIGGQGNIKKETSMERNKPSQKEKSDFRIVTSIEYWDNNRTYQKDNQ